MQDANSTFFGRNEFLLRRLHSLSGLIPVGAYMCVHLLTNATVLDSYAAFQSKVYTIHGLGKLLPFIEWGFIFIPLLFHAIFGVVIIRSGVSNSGTYSNSSNVRYTLQRASGMIAFVFIMWHVFHMHGWFHQPKPLDEAIHQMGGHQFAPYRAASSAGAALSGNFVVPIAYAVGIIACVFHLANGLWTMGITWGLWVSPEAQRRANWVSLGFGVVLGAIGLSALVGMHNVDVDAARKIEDQMYESRVASGELAPNEYKRGNHSATDAHESDEVQESAAMDKKSPADESENRAG